MKMGLLLVLFGLSANASADESIVNMWSCTVKEGKSIEDVHTANAKWVKYMNANVKGGKITSHVVTAIVGKRNMFMYFDSFPSLEAWVESDSMEGDEMDAINAELEATAECSKNSLHRAKAS